MGYYKKRHSNLYQQLVNEYVQQGYTRREAMEIVGNYLDLHECLNGLTNDEDFSRTSCYIRNKEEE